MEKKDIRKKMSAAMKNLSPHQMDESSKKVCEMILSSSHYGESDLVLSYSAMERELNPTLVSASALSDGKKLYLPRTAENGNRMDFYGIDSKRKLDEQLREGRWKIMEPNESCPVLDLETINAKKILMIVPGVAFSPNGKRLGHGMGFYDIYIERLKKMASVVGSTVVLFGVCFSCQIDESVDEVSKDYDATMDSIIHG